MKEPKYKIGDTIIIKKVREKSKEAYRYHFTDEMLDKYGGKVCVIKDIYPAKASSWEGEQIPDDGYVYTLEGILWKWASSMFEDSDNGDIDAFIKKKKCPKLDFNL